MKAVPLTPQDREFLTDLLAAMLVEEYRREAKNDSEGHDELKGKISCSHS